MLDNILPFVAIYLVVFQVFILPRAARLESRRPKQDYDRRYWYWALAWPVLLFVRKKPYKE